MLLRQNNYNTFIACNDENNNNGTYTHLTFLQKIQQQAYYIYFGSLRQAACRRYLVPLIAVVVAVYCQLHGYRKSN